MQQLYRFRRLFWFSIPFWVMSLFGCLPEKTSPAEKAELSANTESSTKPEILWKTTATGSGEESHGHFLLSCSDGGSFKLVRLEVYQQMHEFLLSKSVRMEQSSGKKSILLLVIILATVQSK